jgi:hypothetical protein
MALGGLTGAGAVTSQRDATAGKGGGGGRDEGSVLQISLSW